MARSQTITLLSLDQYAEILGLDPRHFNQLVSTAIPVNNAYNVWYQHQWQNRGTASREDIAKAIATAERMIAEVTGFWPAPKYITQEDHPFPTHRIPSWENEYLPDRRMTVNLKWKRFIAGGHRCVTPIEEGVDISSSRVDLDGDDFAEIMRFTITIAGASDWQPKEIAVFPTTANNLDEREQIRNLTVTISGDDITIEGQSAWFVVPQLWEAPPPHNFIDGDDPDSYLNEVDVYRIYTCSDLDHPPVRYGYQSSETGYATAFGEYYGIIQTYLSEIGQVSIAPATWDADNERWDISPTQFCSGYPDLLRLSYLAGWTSDDQGKMQYPFARAVAALATSLLLSPITGGGESIKGIYQAWQEPPDPDASTFVRKNCPFGDKLGAWEAWNLVNRYFMDYGAISL